MDKHYLIKLVIALFDITETWDRDELLGLKLRNLAGEILESFILASANNPGTDARSNLLKIESEFEKTLIEARRARIIERKAFIFLKQEYEKVVCAVGKEDLKPVKSKLLLEKKSKPNLQKENPHRPNMSGLNERQGKIIKLLVEKQEAQVGQLKEFFPGVSKRTVRRDIDGLLKKDLIVREGKWNDVFYTLA